MRIERRGTGAFMNDRQRKTAISIRGLIKRYPDGTVANRGIDLDVFEGEVLSMLGPATQGKPR
jgi:ABC-type transporter Mla maintaining outer membrane lipid asymmetry ATPase subunit MlaF